MKKPISQGDGVDEKTLRKLLRSVKGQEEMDAVITNGRIINVFTNSIEDGLAVLIKDGWIAGVEEQGRAIVSKKTRVVDAGGKYLCPGLMDAHVHLDSMHAFYAMVPYALRGGTTTVVSETSGVGTACGMAGVEAFMDSTRGYPLRCYFLAPALTPPFPKMETAQGITLAEFKRIMKRPDVLGIGEAYWTRVVEGDQRVLKQAAYALLLRKTLEGHAAGARGTKLNQYLTTGITSCHESITLKEAIEKLRMGVYVMIRDGFVRRDLEALAGLKDTNVDRRRVILVSDNYDAVLLIEEGYMDSIVRRAIGYGFDPIEAIKMTTINVADYYGLRHLGAIAPLRRADILFLSDLRDVRVDCVMSGGVMVVTGGTFTGQAPVYHYPDKMKQTIRTDKVSAEDFRIKAAPRKEQIRVIQVVNETITRETVAKLAAHEGFLEKDISRDILPVAVIDRNAGKNMGRGFITGTGIKDGAVATTLIWDTGNILTIGSSEEGMARAVNRLIELQGGTVVVRKGRISLEFPMPVCGIAADCSLEEVRGKTKALEKAMTEIGSSLPRPFLAIQTIPFTGLPFLRITDKGLVDIKNRRLVPLFV
jgi:adenine deaminase